MVRRKYKGSFTVEAAFILPMIIFIILAIVFLAFYLHDKNRVEGILDLALQKGALSLKHEADFASGRVDYENISDRGIFYPLLGDREPDADKIRSYLWRELEKGLFFTEINDIHVIIDSRNITITLEGIFQIPVQGILDYFHTDTRMLVEAVRPIHNPTDFIRVSEVALDTGSKVKGLGDLQDKIKALTGR